MKKTITISITIILVTFLSHSNVFADGGKHKRERGVIHSNDSQGHRYANHKYAYNKRHNNRNHRYNKHNKSHYRSHLGYQRNKHYYKRNHGHTYHKSYNHCYHRYDKQNYRHNHRSNRRWADHFRLHSLIFNL